MSTKKRPLGLRARKDTRQDENDPKKARPTADEDGLATIALPSSKGEGEQMNDGVTSDDLFELKNQAASLIDDLHDDEEAEQLVNILRGICHEAVRQIEISNQPDDAVPTPTVSICLLYQLLGWATLELGVFLIHENPDKFIQPDEPKSLPEWLAMAAKAIDKLPSKQPPEKNEDVSDLQLLPDAIRALAADNPSAIATSLRSMLGKISKPQEAIYLLRTIGRLIMVKRDIMYDFGSISEVLIKCLRKIQDEFDFSEKNLKFYRRLLHQQLGDCCLSHGSVLAEQVEDKYYPEQDEEESSEEEDFPIDQKDPTYLLALENLRLAEAAFTKLLAETDETDDLKDEIKAKLNEINLTIGNLLPPGPEREALYLRAELSADGP